MLMEKALKREFWQEVKTEEKYRELRNKVITIYNDLHKDEIPVLKRSLRMRFYSDGNRSEFEKYYFGRRDLLASVAFLTLMYPEKDEYLTELEDIIWAVCDEYSWILPAHTSPTPKNEETFIDLFSAETGFCLAEIQYLLKDRLTNETNTRIKLELKRRIVDVFLNNKFDWETICSNWSSVCGGNVGGMLMYAFPEIFEENLPRIVACMESLYKSYPSDGTCLEGPEYWKYGFGAFVWFADMLYQYTNGETDLFKWDNIDTISGFMQRCILKGNEIICFADGLSATADETLQSFLSIKFPEKISLLPKEISEPWPGNTKWMHYFRGFYYMPELNADRQLVLNDYYLSNAAQVILNRGKFSFAIKGGHNNELHNHNDVGTFIISTESGQLICDSGPSEYTRQWFTPSERFNMIQASSKGHCVPIIDGQAQKFGQRFSGQLVYDGDIIRIDFKDTYGYEKLKALRREVKVTDTEILLTDNFDIEYETFTERFVSFFKPEIIGNTVKINELTIVCDSDNCTPVIRKEMCKPKKYNCIETPLYCIDFDLNKGLKDISFRFVFE